MEMSKEDDKKTIFNRRKNYRIRSDDLHFEESISFHDEKESFFNFDLDKNDIFKPKETECSVVLFGDEYSSIYIVATEEKFIDDEYLESTWDKEIITDRLTSFYEPVDPPLRVSASSNFFEEADIFEFFTNLEAHCKKDTSSIDYNFITCYRLFRNPKYTYFNYDNFDHNKYEKSIFLINIKRVFPPKGPPMF